MAEPVNYDSKQKNLIHQLIDAVFSDEELINLCAEHFRPVFNRFTSETSKSAKIRLLVEDCARRGQLAEVIAAIQEAKPDEYAAFAQQVKADAKAATSPSAPPAAPRDTAPLARQRTTTQIIRNPERFIDRSLEGRYRINEILDRGGIGAVFKAYDTKLHLDVAVKIIDLSLVKQPAMVERVRHEVQTAKKLDHPGVVRVYDFGQADSLLYIIMEYISGYNLAEAREQFKGLSLKTRLPQVLRLVQHLCLTVDYMHQQGVLHPGTKPQNVMLKPGQASDMTWRPVLINLGLLRPHREALMAGAQISSLRLTYTVSPELLLGHATDIRSDVYALGVMLYDLVVGRPPFTPQNLEEAIRLHVEAAPPEPRSINLDIPENVQKVILKALAKDPSDRYISAKEMAQAIGDCLEKPALLSLPEHITLSLPNAQLAVTPGETLTTTVELYNEGKQNSRCRLKVQGIPAEWVSIVPSTVTLMPGQVQAIELTIEPPRSPHSRAKHYALAIQINGQRDKNPIDEVKAVLKVGRYAEFDSGLWPEQISAEQIAQIGIENQGNATETFTVRPRPERGLQFQPQQAQLKLGPGDRGKADFRVMPRFRLIGEPIMQTFSFEVSLPEGQSAIHSGEITSAGWVSTRLFVALLTALILIGCVVFSFYNLVSDTLPANATAQAVESAAAAFAAGTAQAIRVEETATRAAAETETWLGLDSDGDDLINSEELAYRTDPNNRDSDGDSLPDGVELKQFGTNPLFADSDFDGVPDNEEVRGMSDAANRDTDGDGISDSLDDDPRQPPTATFTPGPTATQGPIRLYFGRQSAGLINRLPRYTATENQGIVIIDVLLSAPSSQPVRVDYEFLSERYRLYRGTLLFSPGETRQDIEMQLLNDEVDTGGETTMILLSNATPGVEITTRNAELIIFDDD